LGRSELLERLQELVRNAALAKRRTHVEALHFSGRTETRQRSIENAADGIAS
jgi:hypothetical protein